MYSNLYNSLYSAPPPPSRSVTYMKTIIWKIIKNYFPNCKGKVMYKISIIPFCENCKTERNISIIFKKSFLLPNIFFVI